MKWKMSLILIALFLLFILGACGEQEYKGDFERPIEEFTAINQNGEEISTKDYEGKFYIADFIFTSCTDTCPILTANLTRFQQMLKEEGLEDKVQLVSFSADPEIDTPEKLTEFASYHGADLANWDFLTGYSVDEITEFAAGNFKVMATKQDGNVIHQNYFHLVTPDGMNIKNYMGTDPSQLEKLLEDLKNYLD
jgi:protein SCO1